MSGCLCFFRWTTNENNAWLRSQGSDAPMVKQVLGVNIFCHKSICFGLFYVVIYFVVNVFSFLSTLWLWLWQCRHLCDFDSVVICVTVTVSSSVWLWQCRHLCFCDSVVICVTLTVLSSVFLWQCHVCVFQIGETPFFVALDHKYGRVVVCVRGTLSLQVCWHHACLRQYSSSIVNVASSQ
jgi:hypothetical protein